LRILDARNQIDGAHDVDIPRHDGVRETGRRMGLGGQVKYSVKRVRGKNRIHGAIVANVTTDKDNFFKHLVVHDIANVILPSVVNTYQSIYLMTLLHQNICQMGPQKSRDTGNQILHMMESSQKRFILFAQ
jgi:hypothetical protein